MKHEIHLSYLKNCVKTNIGKESEKRKQSLSSIDMHQRLDRFKVFENLNRNQNHQVCKYVIYKKKELSSS